MKDFLNKSSTPNIKVLCLRVDKNNENYQRKSISKRNIASSSKLHAMVPYFLS